MRRLSEFVFQMRGFTPVPFLFISLFWAHYNIYLLVTGALTSMAGELLRIQAIKYAGGATRTRNVGAEELVTTGPYAIMRNPLYFGNMLIYIGFAIGSGAFVPYLPLVALAFFSYQYYLIIALEEDTLTELFGKSYLIYCQAVPRLFPKFLFNKGGLAPNFPVSEAFRQERSTLLGIVLAWFVLVLRLYSF